MSRLNKLVPLIGSLLLSKGGRRVAGRHAGKLALATLAYEVWRNRREGAKPQVTPRPAATALPKRRSSACAGTGAAPAASISIHSSVFMSFPLGLLQIRAHVSGLTCLVGAATVSLRHPAMDCHPGGRQPCF